MNKIWTNPVADRSPVPPTTDAGTTHGRRRSRRGRQALAAAGVAALLTALPATPALATPLSDAPLSVTTRAQHSTPGTEQKRGALLSVTALGRLDRDQVVSAVRAQGYDADTARHGVTSYRLTYRTITPQGRPTTASGLLVLPLDGPRRLPAVVHTHGTLAYRGYAPSVADGPDRTVSLLYASAGRAAVAPDYLGLGTGPGRHPYMDARSSAVASLDMLRAARSAARQLGVTLDGRTGITGFSQGGQVAMELGRQIARGADRRFSLRALAPVGGPFDLEGSELPGMFDGRVNDRSAVFYVSFFLTAQNRLHGLYSDPREVFRAPYAERVEALFDGEHPAGEIAGKLPGTLKELLTDTWYKKMQAPSGALLRTLRTNDRTCDWSPGPKVDLTLYTASGDRDVPIANTRTCARRLAQHGTPAKVIDQGKDANHYASFTRSLPRIARSLPVAR
ncbi:lipase family protein [Streptomyces sp. MST-110588]|uniref:alpha/beta hydrolase family protein n=1 Tax=Streptomyces sp. MST-110588 TaxID=2833628 RepID=UPI001F5D2499|nr:lipase family protein [Streptomyces sp. MST-110588]UNO42333.1 alpha/beta hydrolase [Streptomyces sp. MST-110588]